MNNIILDDGTIVRNVPDGVTKEQVQAKVDAKRARDTGTTGGDYLKALASGVNRIGASIAGSIDNSVVGDVARMIGGTPTRKAALLESPTGSGPWTKEMRDAELARMDPERRAQAEAAAAEYLKASPVTKDIQQFFSGNADYWNKDQSKGAQAKREYVGGATGIVDALRRYKKEPQAALLAATENVPQIGVMAVTRKAPVETQLVLGRLGEAQMTAEEARQSVLADAKQKGASPSEAIAASNEAADNAYSAALAASMVGGVGEVAALRRLTGAKGAGPVVEHGFMQIPKQAGKEAAEEFIQEGSSQIAQNAAISGNYDPARALLDGAGVAGVHGAVAGGVMGAGTGAMLVPGQSEEEKAAADAAASANPQQAADRNAAMDELRTAAEQGQQPEQPVQPQDMAQPAPAPQEPVSGLSGVVQRAQSNTAPDLATVVNEAIASGQTPDFSALAQASNRDRAEVVDLFNRRRTLVDLADAGDLNGMRDMAARMTADPQEQQSLIEQAVAVRDKRRVMATQPQPQPTQQAEPQQPATPIKTPRDTAYEKMLADTEASLASGASDVDTFLAVRQKYAGNKDLVDTDINGVIDDAKASLSGKREVAAKREAAIESAIPHLKAGDEVSAVTALANAGITDDADIQAVFKEANSRLKAKPAAAQAKPQQEVITKSPMEQAVEAVNKAQEGGKGVKLATIAKKYGVSLVDLAKQVVAAKTAPINTNQPEERKASPVLALPAPKDAPVPADQPLVSRRGKLLPKAQADAMAEQSAAEKRDMRRAMSEEAGNPTGVPVGMRPRVEVPARKPQKAVLPDVILRTDGKPFPNEAEATRAMNRKGAQETHEVAPAPQGSGVVVKRKKANTIDIEKDDILAAIAKAGGVDWEQARKQGGFDPAESGRRGSGILRVFKKNGGMTLDGMAEMLSQYGYPVTDENGDYTVNALLDAMDVALHGGQVGTTQFNERLAREMYEQEAELRALDDSLDSGSSGDMPSWLDDSAESLAESFIDNNVQPSAVMADALNEVENERKIASPVAGTGQETDAGAEARGGQGGNAQAAGLRGAEQQEGQSGIGQDPGVQAGFQLEAQTEAERFAEEQRQALIAESQRKEEESARLRAQAEREISSFTLTGSDRPADVAMAAGQNDLFAPKTRGQKEAEKAAASTKTSTTISDADYAQVVEAAKYLKDIVYSLDNLLGDDKRLLLSLSPPLGKSGRDTILMDAFNVTRDVAHNINNQLDDRKPHKLRAVDMQDALDVFPVLKKVIDDAKEIVRKRDERMAQRNAAAPDAPAVESKPEPVKWFGSRDKAEAWIAKVSKVNGGSYHVVQAGPSRFEVFAGEKSATPNQINKQGNPARKRLGVNYRGETLYEDEMGVRSYATGGVLVSESVSIIPGKGIERGELTKEYKTADELAAEKGQESGKTAPAEDLDSMFDDVLAEVTGKPKAADIPKASVESVFTGEPDPKNSAPMQELGGFAVGDKVAISGRSVSEGVIRQLFTRQSSGGEMNMARVEIAGGKTLDLLTDNLSRQERTAGQAAASAAKNTGMALGEAIDGLGKLFGGKGTLNSGLTFDKETYAKAKPYFIAAISYLKAAGSDLRETMRAVIKMVVDKFGVDAAENMKPYVVQFISDVRDGKIDDPAATLNSSDTNEATGNDVRKLDTTGQGALEGVSSGEVQGAATGRGTGSGTDEGGRGDGGADGSVAGAGSNRNGGMGNSSERVPVSGTGAGGSGRGRSRSSGGKGRAVSAQSAASNEQESSGGLTVDANQPSMALEPGRIDPPQLTEDFIIEDDLGLGEGGQRTKYKNNVEAIRLIRDLEATGRTATTDEQKALAKYVGWGGIPQAFDPDNKDWSAQYAELKSLLSADEWDAAFESTQYAHYTSREIINGMYAAVRRLGFTGGNVLEAGGGVGNFIGLMPVDLRTNGKVTLIERENIAAAIAKHLYPRQNVRSEDFTEFGKGQDGQYDMQIGNPPFSSNPLTDKSGRKHLTGLSVHNYFITKGVDMLRDGGIMAVVVSNSFMDASNSRAREYIAKRAKLLGAIRLPNNAFSKNANTQVTTDIIFLQKLPESEHGSKAAIADGKRWVGVTTVSDPQGKGEVALNQYFADNMGMMLGEWGAFGTMYGPDQPALVARPGQDTAAMMARAVAALPEGVYTPASVSRTKAMEGALLEKLHDNSVGEGGFYVNGGKLWRRVADAAGEEYAAEITPNTVISGTRQIGQSGVDRLRQLAELRRTMRELLAAETEDRKADMDRLRKELNTRYDAYTADNGRINDPTTKRLMRDDPDYPLIAALEMDYEPGIGPAAAKTAGIKPQTSKAKKAAIFNQRVIEVRKAVTKADSPQDAVNVSMAERGRLDAEYIGRLLDVPADEVLGQLASGTNPLLFRDPATDEYVLRDAYLSGNVREKLKQAKAAGLTSNARALEEVQPEDIPASKVSVRIGSPWVPVSVYADFASNLFGEGTKTILRYVKSSGGFSGVIIPGSEVMASTKFGTKSYHGDAILLALMNNRQIKVMTKDGDGKPTVDAKATEEANSKADDIKQAFQDWIFKDADRAEVLVRAYNDANNNYVVRKYDGSWLKFPGKVPDAVIRFRRHQRNAIARTIQDRTTLYDHVVGAGKTFTAIASAMEMRRMGLVRKPLMVVPNHLVGQWASDFYRLYPGAKVLAATKKDFERENRRRFLAKIASGDWDAVIIAHSSFGYIRPSAEFEQKFIQEEIDRIMREAKAVDESEGDEQQKKRTVKQLAAMQERLENRIAKLREKPMDDLLDFQQIGVDQLFVDEAHLFKNLMYTTKMQNIRGLNDPTGSQRAYDMYIKTNQIMEMNGRGQGVVFMTGTPVSNSLAEMYHMMRYLMPTQMRQLGFESFDAWANTYADINTVFVPKPSGDGFKQQSRFSKFSNAHQLLATSDQVIDTVTMDDIKAAYKEETGKDFPLPRLLTGRRQPVSLEKTPLQEAYMKQIIERLKKLESRKGPPKKGEDNHLSVMSDSRKASMDIRLADKSVIEREENGRVDRASSEIFSRWKKYDDERGTQLVFADLGTPVSTAKREVREYDAIMARITAGEDPETIASAQLGDEAAVAKVNDSEDARSELDAKGDDWLTAIEGAKRGFSVYDDLKKALMEKGVPENQIAFIHSYNTDDQKSVLFRKVNNGEIRILMGSTDKMGAGTNVQKRLVALHHLDVPWKPSDLEQREGRIIRQGNELADKNPDFEVEILAYATKDTLDSFMWDLQGAKLKGINQLRTRDIDNEIPDAFAELEMSAGEMQAAATGNTDMLREIQLRTEVQKMERRQRAFDAGKSDAIAGIRRATREIESLPVQIAAYERLTAASNAVQQDVADARARFKATINGKEYTNHTEAAKALRDLVDAVETGEDGKERKAKLDVAMNGEQFTNRQKLAEAFARLTGDNEPFVFDAGDGKVYRVDDAADAVMDTIASSRDSEGEKLLGNMGDYKVSIEYGGEKLNQDEVFEVHASLGDDDLPSAVVRAKPGDDRHAAKEILKAVRNMVRDAGSALSSLKASLEKAKKNLADLSKIDTTSEWPDSDKLARMREEHRALRDKMNKEAESKKAAESDDSPRMSTQPENTGPGLTTSRAREILSADPVLSKALPFIDIRNSKEGVPEGAEPMYLPAWHGSPHKFDKFSLEHIGKGEGEQAYGWGLYFSGSKAVAEFYRKALTYPDFDSVEIKDILKALKDGYYRSSGAVADTVDMLEDDGYMDESGNEKPYARFAVDDILRDWWNDPETYGRVLRIAKDIGATQKNGQLYKVDIPEDGNYLLWDAPASEQSSAVKNALLSRKADKHLKEHAQKNRNLFEYLGETEMSGSDIYEALSIGFGSPEKASRFLNSLGISGIKYLDGSSRAKGDGSYNYVVFDDSAVRIMETFYSAGDAGAEGYYHNGRITLFADNIRATGSMSAEERLKWVAFHEITHRGVANLAESQAYLSELERAGKNPYVKNLAKKIYEARQSLDAKYHVSMEVAIEEALAEINAALRTGNVKQIKEQYGLHFPLSIRPRAKSAVARFFEVVKRIVNRMFGRGLTDAQVEDLLRRTNDAGMTPDGGPGRGKDYDAAVFSLADKGDGSPTESALAEARRQLDEQLAIADRMIAERGGLFAPNGEPSKLNRHQWAQVRTANFKAWFGDWVKNPAKASKVVDTNGEPLVVYHGTRAMGFNEFKLKSAEAYGLGVYFASDRTMPEEEFGVDGRVIEAFLNIRNPSDGSMPKIKKNSEALKKLRQSRPRFRGDEYDAFEEYGDFRGEAIREVGHDGIIAENDEYGIELVAFSPNQIKSATGNAGTFSPATDDIRYSPSPKDWITEQGRITKRVLSKEVAQRDLSLWQKTLGTQLNAALKNPAFKKVYDLTQRLIQHVNNDAYDSLNAAPDVLSRLEDWNDYKRDLGNTAKEAGSALMLRLSKRRKDMAAAAEVLFEGTRFDKKVYSDKELDAFKLTADQKEIYRQARAAIDKSVGNAGKSQALNVAMNAEAINWATVERLVNMDLDPEVLFSEVSDLIDTRLAATKMEAENSTNEAEIKKLDKQVDKLVAALVSIDEIQAIVDKSATEGYAPLMRWGKYTVAVIDPVDGKTLRFHMLESKREQAALELKLREKYGAANVVGGVLDEGKFEQFKGITPETVALFASVTGMDQDAAYQEYLKLAIPGRSALKRKIHRKGDMGEGIEGFSTDLPRVLSSFVLSNARKSARDLYRGPVNDAIKDINAGGVAEKARELAEFVMEPDENDWSVGIRNMLFVWNMGASVAFGVLNLSQPWMMTLPWLSQFQDPASAAVTMAKAAKLAASAQASGKAPKGYEAEYDRAAREGIVDPQNVFMLQGVERGKSGVGTNIWRNVAHGMGLIASATESMNRKLTLIAALDVARSKGDDWLKSKGFADAYDFAARSVAETQGVYNKGNRPAWARNPALAVILVFKQYSINWVEMASRMASNHYGDDRYRKGFWMLIGALFMMAGGMGLPFAEDLIDLIEAGMSWAGKPVNVERQMQMALGKDLYEPLMNGPANSLLFNAAGADMFGRMSMGNMIPATAIANPGLTPAARSDEAIQALGAGAGLASKFMDAYNLAAAGKVGQAAITASPRAVTSVAKAVEMAATGQYKDSKGRNVRDVTPAEALIKGLDLQPASVARIQRERGRRFKDEAIQAQARTEIRNELIDAYEAGDQDAIDAANTRLRTWNAENPLYPVHINRRTLRKSVRERGKNWSARDEATKGMEWMNDWIPESSK